MTQLAGANTGADLAAYRARESALFQIREAAAASDTWDGFRAALEALDMPEARVR